MQRMSISIFISKHLPYFSLTAFVITESYLRCPERQRMYIAASWEKCTSPAEPIPFHRARGSFAIPLIIPFFLAINNTHSAVCVPLTGQTEYKTIFASDPRADPACRGRNAVEPSGLSCSCLCVVGVPKVTNSHRQ